MSRTYEQLEPVISALDERISAKAAGNEVINLKSAFDYNASLGKACEIPASFLSHGTWYNRVFSASTSYLSNETLIHVTKGSVLKIGANPDTLNYSFGVYVEDGTASSGYSGWKTDANTDYTIEYTGELFVQVRKASYGNISRDEMTLEISIVPNNFINDIENNTTSVSLANQALFSPDNEYSVDCEIANGTIANPGNTSAIYTTTFVKAVPGLYSSVSTTKPVKASGNYYAYGWQTYDKDKQLVRNQNYSWSTKSNKVLIEDGEEYVRFVICEYASNATTVANRTTDYSGYDVAIKIEATYLTPKTILGTLLSNQSESNDNDVVNLNKDMDTSLVAATGYNTYLSGDWSSSTGEKKNLSFAVISDIHGTSESLDRFVEYCNTKKDYLDFALGLGDFVGIQPTESTSWMDSVIGNSEIPFYYVVGNHDAADTGRSGISQSDARTKYYSTIVTKEWLTADNFIGTGKCSWKKDFSDYNIRIISLYEYGNSNTVPNNAPASYCRRWLDTELLQWFADTLYSTPEGYSVIVLLHQIPFAPMTLVENPFTITSDIAYLPNHWGSVFLNTINGNPIEEIVNAFINSTSISKTYSSISDYDLGKTATVNKDFSSRTEDGNFVAYIVGHTHGSYILNSNTYPDQKCIVVTTGSESIFQRKYGDITYDAKSRNKDSFYIIGINTDMKKVNLMQIGGQTTIDMRKRIIGTVDY